MSGQVLMGSKSEEKLSGPDLMEIAKDSVVRITSELEGRGGHGSAFAYKQVMTETGSTVYFLTNLHNFSSVLQLRNVVFDLASQGRPDDDLLIKTTVDFRGQTYSVDKIVSCKGALLDSFQHFQDFAIFSVNTDIGEEMKMFALPEANDARPGENVYAFGFPDFTDLGITEGIISHVYRDHENPLLQHQIQHSILINPGNSGGPTVNANGVAVGMSTWGKTLSGGKSISGMNFSVNVARAFEICRDNDLIEEVSMERIYQHFVARAREYFKYGS
jgi:S1-C subfamily serine protease